MRLLVIGGVAAGLSAAARARRIDPSLEIVVLEQGPVVSYGACGLPYFVEGRVARAQQLIVYTPEYFRKERRSTVRTGARAAVIAHARREAQTRVKICPSTRRCRQGQGAHDSAHRRQTASCAESIVPWQRRADQRIVVSV